MCKTQLLAIIIINIVIRTNVRISRIRFMVRKVDTEEEKKKHAKNKTPTKAFASWLWTIDYEMISDMRTYRHMEYCAVHTSRALFHYTFITWFVFIIIDGLFIVSIENQRMRQRTQNPSDEINQLFRARRKQVYFTCVLHFILNYFCVLFLLVVFFIIIHFHSFKHCAAESVALFDGKAKEKQQIYTRSTRKSDYDKSYIAAKQRTPS